MLKLRQGVVELYRKVATSLPPDIESALKGTAEIEIAGSEARQKFDDILDNVALSRQGRRPLCMGSGIPVFYVHAPKGLSHKDIENTIIEATRMATEKIPLASNAVDVITNTNTGDNTGIGFPIIHIEETEGSTLTVELIIKAASSEIEGRTYRLPDDSIGAGRDLEGIKKCVLDTVNRAGGRGCPPYIIGVGVGSTRYSAVRLSEEQLLRRLTDKNPNDTLMRLEDEILREINSRTEGPLALGVKIGVNHRHPDAYVVDVSLSCYTHRRGKLIW